MLLNVNKSEALNGRRTLMTEELEGINLVGAYALQAPQLVIAHRYTLFPAITSAVLFLIPSFILKKSQAMSSDTWPPQLKFVIHVNRS